MHKKITIIAAIFIACYLPSSFAQQGKPSLDKKLGDVLGNDINLQQVEYNYLQNLWSKSYGNYSYILQVGNINAASINQFKTSSTGYGNSAAILQSSTNNTAVINQNGNNNTGATVQVGNNNNASTTVNGNNNNTLLFQYGNDNQATQDITGDSKTYYLLQSGNDNSYYQNGTNAYSQGYKVFQIGSGMHLKILNGRY